MPNTFELIASSTVGSGGAASILFSSIPSTYTDIVVKLSVRSDRASVGPSIGVKINGSLLNLTSRILSGSGAAASSASYSDAYIGDATGANATSSTFSNQEVYFPNYAGSTNKSYSADSAGENNATTAYLTLSAGLWSQTSAITSLEFYDRGVGNFVQYSTAYLYGVKNA
jgi:hypothetical protein